MMSSSFGQKEKPGSKNRIKQTNFSTIKCIGNNIAVQVCLSDCKHPAFICAKFDKCRCMIQHSGCTFTLLKFIQRDIKKKQQLANKAKLNSNSGFRAFEDILNSIIKKIQDVRRQVLAYEDNQFLTKIETSFVNFIQQEKYYRINGAMIKQMMLSNSYQTTVSESQIKQSWKGHLLTLHSLFKKFKQDLYKQQPLIKMINVQQQQLIKNWLKQQTGKVAKQFKLLYRASQNNFSIKKFHQKCDYAYETVTIVKTQFDKVIGGFSPQRWLSTQLMFKKDASKSAFMFSLTEKQKYRCTDYQKSILCADSYGPCFGGYISATGQFKKGDLAISDNANVLKASFSEFPCKYNLNYLSNANTWAIFSGQINDRVFKIQQWQVYQVKLIT